MANIVLYPNGKKVFVKNLGWLIRHLSIYTIRSINVWTEANLFGDDSLPGADLFVHFENGIDFSCTFADVTVLRDWLNRRRALQGELLNWNGVEELIGG